MSAADKPTSTVAPPHLVVRFRELRAKAESVGLEAAEHTEYLVLQRVMQAYERVAPVHHTRVDYEQRMRARLDEMEADARELRERAEYLQGLRKDPPVPRKQVYVVHVQRPKAPAKD